MFVHFDAELIPYELILSTILIFCPFRSGVRGWCCGRRCWWRPLRPRPPTRRPSAAVNRSSTFHWVSEFRSGKPALCQCAFHRLSPQNANRTLWQRAPLCQYKFLLSIPRSVTPLAHQQLFSLRSGFAFLKQIIHTHVHSLAYGLNLKFWIGANWELCEAKMCK